jgi:N-methylhydantoinase A/oxoprolinase/acetone carboxylase beta subunit
MRYELQEWELRVRLPDLRFDPGTTGAMSEAFHVAHHARYGFSRPDKPVELVTLYLDAVVDAPDVRDAAPVTGGADALAERRAVWTGGGEAAGDVPVYDRARLAEGAELPGPCIVEEPTATTYVHPGWVATVDAAGTLIATARPGA